MQRTVGLARAGSGRSQRNNFGYHLSNLNYDGKIAGLYDLEETLGRGHFAVVKLARHVFTGEKVAVKVIDKTKLDEISRSHLFQEVRCMKLVQHPNVVRLYEVIDTQTKLYLILELGDGGDLYDYIMRHENGLDQQSARHYFRQVVHAISYCHQLHVVHRDLKPENVVFFEKLGMVKLTDFGFSNKYNPGQKLETSCGSLAYSAPEILLGDSYDAPAVDIWSLGVILYMLVCGHPPFQEANDSETLTMIMDCKYTVPPHVSEGCRRLIGRMLQRDPALRANLEQIANDPWLQEGSGIIQPAHYLPLVSREHLSEEDHALILQKMVNGNIATKEEILDALDKDEYNNITATYFLLAERKLRAQRQEQALSLSRGQPPPPPPPPPTLQEDEEETVIEELPSNNVLTRNLPMVTMESLQTSSVVTTGRQRKCSAVEEEDEAAGASGSESSRRSQRSSSTSLASQRTSNTSIASQRASNNSLAGSLRARGLLNNTSLSGRSSELRLELTSCGEKTTLGACPKLPSLPEQQPEQSKNTDLSSSPSPPPSPPPPAPTSSVEIFVPAPFPMTSGIGLRSPRVSPLTSPVTGQKSSSERTTPGSVSPTSPASTPSSPSSTGQNRSSLPSPPSRVLHTVRSSPQLILNEIFEEAESCSDNETVAPASSTTNSALVSKTMRQHHQRGVNGMVRQRTGGSHQPAARASSASPSSMPKSSSSPPSLVRRYEQRRQLIKARTASCSSSDASDDDNEGRKKRAEKLASAQFPPPPARRDSHEDSSSDHGGDGCIGGHRGVIGGASSVESSKSGSAPEASKGTDNSASGASSVRSHLLPSIDCSAPVDDEQCSNPSSTPTGSRSNRYRTTPNGGRRYTNAACSFSLLSPGLGSETHLRASQSLSCLTEVCDEMVPLADCARSDLLQLPDASLPSRLPVPAKSCSNLKDIKEADVSSAMVLLLRPCTSLPIEPNPSVVVSVQDVAMKEAGGNSAHDSCSCRPSSSTLGKKHKRLKQLFSRRDQGSSNSSFKKSEKRGSSRKHRGRGSGGHIPKSESTQVDASAGANPAEQPDASETTGRTMGGFLRSRLYKAKSLGSLLKDRIACEASHCQYELWKRLGRKGGHGDVNMNGGGVLSTALPALANKPPSATPAVVVVVDNTTQHCSSC